VSDFGLARIVEKADGEFKIKSELGPLKWMVTIYSRLIIKLKKAPESLKSELYSEKSDVFSYGVVFPKNIFLIFKRLFGRWWHVTPLGPQ
jgi:serine/threonine protein kinase